MRINEEPILISLEDAALRLDMVVKTVRNQVSEGRFPILTVKIGGARKVPKHLVNEFINGLINAEMEKTTVSDTSTFESNNRGRPRKVGNQG